MVRQKSSLDKKSMLHNPAFERTLLRSKEFGHAGKNMQLIYRAFKSWSQDYADCRMSGRLTRQILAIKDTDETHIDGEKMAAYGNLSLLEGFELNKDSSLQSCIECNYRIEYTAEGICIDMPGIKVQKLKRL